MSSYITINTGWTKLVMNTLQWDSVEDCQINSINTLLRRRASSLAHNLQFIYSIFTV